VKKELVKIITVLSSSYSKEIDLGVVELYFDYANEDVKKGLMTWELFFTAFRKAGKECVFFPKYVEITNIIKSIKQEERYNYEPKRELTQLSKEEGKQRIEQIRERLNGEKNVCS